MTTGSATAFPTQFKALNHNDYQLPFHCVNQSWENKELKVIHQFKTGYKVIYNEWLGRERAVTVYVKGTRRQNKTFPVIHTNPVSTRVHSLKPFMVLTAVVI